MGLKTYSFEPQFILNILTQGFIYNMECTKGIPKGARFVSAESREGKINITVEHNSFPVVTKNTVSEKIEFQSLNKS